jgi:hypothetical protein
MAGDNDKDKKGFSGLSDLASEVSGVDEPIKQEPQSKAKPVKPKQHLPSQTKSLPSEQEQKNTSSGPARIACSDGNCVGVIREDGKCGICGKDKEWIASLGESQLLDTVGNLPRSSRSRGKWIFGIIGVIFVIWLINSGDQTNKKPSYSPPSSSQSYSYPQSSPAPAVQTPSTTQSAGLQYTQPSVGTNNVLSVPEIRWCIREGIRIEAMRDVIDTNAGIDEFNLIVNDNNSRCGSYRYREGSQSIAERDVEAYRSQIVSEAIGEAMQLGRSSQLPDPAVSPSASTSSTPKKPKAQLTRAAQQFLTDLGYDPGPVDGGYGRRTIDAVKAFQRDANITQDGWIDEDLLSTLQSAKAAYKLSSGSQLKPQTESSLQPQASTPSAVNTVTPENLSFEEQSKYSAAQRLSRLGYDVNWRTSSLTDMLDAESRIGTANRLSRLGYDVNWRTSSLTDMLDAESRIGTANRLKRKGISVDWRNYSLTQMLNMENGQN